MLRKLFKPLTRIKGHWGLEPTPCCRRKLGAMNIPRIGGKMNLPAQKSVVLAPTPSKLLSKKKKISVKPDSRELGERGRVSLSSEETPEARGRAPTVRGVGTSHFTEGTSSCRPFDPREERISEPNGVFYFFPCAQSIMKLKGTLDLKKRTNKQEL